MMASERNGTLYVGVTSNLLKRVYEHRNNLIEGFSKRYHVHVLVWYESHETMENAIMREKNIKKWNCAWKLGMIERTNPIWQDLYEQIVY